MLDELIGNDSVDITGPYYIASIIDGNGRDEPASGVGRGHKRAQVSGRRDGALGLCYVSVKSRLSGAGVGHIGCAHHLTRVTDGVGQTAVQGGSEGAET